MAIALFDGFDVQSMAFAAPDMGAEWKVAHGAFGIVLSASFLGILIGNALFGSLGDRFGRRPVIVGAVLSLGIVSLITALAENLPELILLRVGTGIAIGGCLPNVTALTAENVPGRSIGRWVILMYSAVPLGGVVGGYLAPWLIGWGGWRAIFVAGGVFPLLLALLLWFRLPESPFHRLRAGMRSADLREMLGRMFPDMSLDPSTRVTLPRERKHAGLAALFDDDRIRRTLAIWAIFFLSLAGMYTLQSWLPALFGERGWPKAAALRSAALFQLGGIAGGLAGAWLSERFGPLRILCGLFVLAALMVASIGFGGGSIGTTTLRIALAGFAVVGAQQCMTAFTAAFYDSDARAAGVGWGLGIGRLGAVIGPSAAGFALSAGLGQTALFMLVAVPSLLCCPLLLILRSPSPARA